MRSRLYRGTLDKETGTDGTVYVRLHADQLRHDDDQTAAQSQPNTELVGELRARVEDLREQLAEEREARRRADTIIAQLARANEEQARTIRELEAPSEPPSDERGSPETVEEEPERAESPGPIRGRRRRAHSGGPGGGGCSVADARFGRVVLQTRTNETYTLDLYEAEGIICRGFYLPPLGSPLPAEIPSEVEFAAPADVWDLLQESLFGGEVSDELRQYALADPRVSNSRFYVDMAAAPAAERREAEVWTGHVRAGLGEFTFVLEQYGSPEIAAVLIIICILLFFDQHASEHAAECYRQAAETCGEGRIRSVHVARRLTGTTLRVETECQFECVEHGSSG